MNKDDPTPAPKSKSQLKRDMLALQKLGEQLIKLNSNQIKQLPLDEALLAAVLEGQAISSHIALRRHVRYMAKLLDECDVTAIQHALTKLQNQDQQATGRLHRTEKWRERLLNEGNPALTEFINAFPHAETQVVRQLIKQVQKEQQHNQPPHAARKLFRYIRDLAEGENHDDQSY